MSDFDGDIVMTTDQKEFIENASLGLPITYESQKVDKTTITDDKLQKADMDAFYTKIGFITNCSTTMYSMLPNYEKGSLQYDEVVNRLKICRKEQGSQIDKSKGLIVKPFPQHWTRWTKVAEEVEGDETEHALFNNSILIDKRPYFMRYLYSNYNRDYKKFKDGYNTYCIANFGVELEELLEQELDEDSPEHDFLNKYDRFEPLIDSECVMNNICHHMEEKIGEIKRDRNSKTPTDIVSLLKDISIPLDKEKLKLLYDVYREYQYDRRNFANLSAKNSEVKFKTIQQYNKYIRKKTSEISSDLGELTNLATIICYELYPSDSKSFVWKIFGDGIVENLKKNRQEECVAPFLDEDGDIAYLGNNYKMKMIEVDPLEEQDDYIR